MECNQRRQCDVGSALEQNRRFESFCNSHACPECPANPEKQPGVRCSMIWSQLPYDGELTPETIKSRNLAAYASREDAQRAFVASLPERFSESLNNHPLAALDMFCDWLFQQRKAEGASDGVDQTKTRKAPGVPRIKPCICGGLGVYETRRTESASDVIMPLIEYRVRCDRCGRATHWHFDECVKAEAEWNAVAGSYDECNRPE